MKTDDWYRKSTWSTADEEEFNAKLSRARGQRSEYLRIQAWALVETRNPKLSEPAIRLANQYLRENPDGIFKCQVHLAIAKAFESTGNVRGALDAYRKAIEEEKNRPNVRCLAYLEFAWFVATRGLREAFDEVLKAMEASFQQHDLVFPLSQYKYFGALALISNGLGDKQHASRMARNALTSATKEGPFTRHRTLGLVEGIDPVIARQIERLAC